MAKHLPVLAQSERTTYLRVEHERIRFVQRAIFSASFTASCDSHQCLCRDENDKPRLDACCQHGADVTIPEKQAILRRAREIASVLKPERHSPAGWFDEREPEEDPEAPFGFVVRTATSDPALDSSGCVFLEHASGRGCGLHLAAQRHGFDPAEIKPAVCRLYPLTFSEGQLKLAPDFDRYSCANTGERSVYEIMRSTLDEMFGEDSADAIGRAGAQPR
jgi:Fe-S-cluster containining protein